MNTRGRGRPAFVPADEMRNSVKLMAASGILQRDIAGALGISDVTLRKYFADEIARCPQQRWLDQQHKQRHRKGRLA